MKSAAMNPRVVVGNNNPPSPFEEAERKINDLYDEAKNWLDGAKVESQGVADEVGKLLNMLREAVNEADAARVKENEPFDEGKAVVQAKYAPLIADTKKQKGKAILAIEGCKAALAPWLAKLRAEQEAAAKKAREEAEAKAAAAQAALRSADVSNLEEREKAEVLIQDAKKAERIATSTEKATAKVSGGGGRAISMTTTRVPVVKDYAAAARYLWTDPVGKVALTEAIDRFVRQAANPLSIPGVEMVEEHSVR